MSLSTLTTASYPRLAPDLRRILTFVSLIGTVNEKTVYRLG